MGKLLSNQERSVLLAELKLERSRKYADRIRIILLLDDGKTYKSIAEYLFLYESSIANYRKRYVTNGLEGLINDNYQGKMVALSPKELMILSCDLQSKIFATTKAVISHIKNGAIVKK